MTLYPAELLIPIFNALDALISNHGVYFDLVFVWLSPGAIAWVLGGGLRRNQLQGNAATVVTGIIITTRPPMRQLPPFISANIDPVQNDDNEIMDEPCGLDNAVAFSFRQRYGGGRCVPAPFQWALRLPFTFPLAEPLTEAWRYSSS
jgi:hypothetical protein